MAAPSITAPASVLLPQSVAIHGIVIVDAFAASNPGTMAIDLACNGGTLTVAGHPAARTMTLNLTLAQANAALATLTYATASGAADTITIVAWNQSSANYSASIAVGPPAPAAMPGKAGTQARRVRDFSAMLAVNTHLDFGVTGATPQYAPLANVAKAVNLIWGQSGVPPLLRDSPWATTDIALWEAFAAQTGRARFISYIGECVPSTAFYEDYVNVALAMMAGMVAFLEGPNEPDSAAVNGLTGGATEAQALSAAAAFMPTLHAVGVAHGLPVINMSFGQGWTAANDWHGNYDKVGDLSASVAFGNAHTYPQNGDPPAVTIAAMNGNAALAAPGRPVAITELGYLVGSGGAAVAQDVAAKYLLAGWADAFTAGAPVYGIYALFDDMSGAWGLFAPDGTPRLAATALSNMLTVLADAGATAATFSPGMLAYGIPGCASILLQASDGAFLLLLWAEATVTAATNPVSHLTLSLGGAATSIEVFDPVAGIAAVAPAVAGESLGIAVPVYPVVVRIVA